MKHGPQPAATTAIRHVPPADDSLPPLDLARLAALLVAVGPQRSGPVLDQLVSDLQAIAQGLGPAIAARHWPEARRFAHNLAAIAGTAGAARLADRARCLHADCQHEDAPDASAVLPEMLTLIDALQATLTRHRNPPVTR